MQMLLAENDVVNNEIKIKYDKLITFSFFCLFLLIFYTLMIFYVVPVVFC